MKDEDKSIVENAQAVKKFFDEWPMHLEVIRLRSRICKARYDALRREGFDRVDAMLLCTKQVEL